MVEILEDNLSFSYESNSTSSDSYYSDSWNDWSDSDSYYSDSWSGYSDSYDWNDSDSYYSDSWSD